LFENSSSIFCGYAETYKAGLLQLLEWAEVEFSFIWGVWIMKSWRRVPYSWSIFKNFSRSRVRSNWGKPASIGERWGVIQLFISYAKILHFTEMWS